MLIDSSVCSLFHLITLFSAFLMHYQTPHQCIKPVIVNLCKNMNVA